MESPLELNLSAPQRTKIQQSIESKKLHVELFDSAIREMEILLMLNCYPAFRAAQLELLP